MFYFKESKLAIESKFEVTFFDENKSQLQNLQKFRIPIPNNLSKLNVKNIGTSYLVQKLKYDYLLIIFDENSGTEFQKAGKKLTAADILNVIKNIIFDHSIVLSSSGLISFNFKYLTIYSTYSDNSLTGLLIAPTLSS